jgi:hypothetical protein
MIENNISLKEVMQLFYSGNEADIEIITYSAQRKKGGEKKRLEGVRLNMKSEPTISPNEMKFFDIETNNKQKPLYRPAQTINLILKNGNLHKVYRVLITKFNNKTVRI